MTDDSGTRRYGGTLPLFPGIVPTVDGPQPPPKPPPRKSGRPRKSTPDALTLPIFPNDSPAPEP